MPKPADPAEPISLRLPAEVLAGIEAVAAASERTRSWVMVRALKRYLASEGADVLAIADGERETSAGQSHDFDEVIQESERIVRSVKAA